MVWILVGVRCCVAVDTGHGLVTLLSLSVSVKDRSLYKASWANHRFIIPSTYLGMGAWKTCCSLVADPALSGPTVRVLFWWRRSLHRTECGTQGRGLESQFGRGPGHPGQESDGLVLLVPGYKRGVCFQGTQLGALIRELPGYPVRLVYGLAS